MKTLFSNCIVVPMTAESAQNATFKGWVGVIDRRIALVTDNAQKAEEFKAEHPDLKEIDCTNKVVMPGLINTHAHVAMTLLRGYADDLALMEWLNNHIWPFEGKLTAEDIMVGMELGIAEMQLGGVTSVIDMYWHEDRCVEVAERMGMRALLGCSYLDGMVEGFEKTLEKAVKAAEGSNVVRIAVAPHAPYTTSPENMQLGKRLSNEIGTPFITHIAETQDEIAIINERYGKTPVEHLNDIGVLDSNTLGAHCVYLNDSDIEIMKQTGAIVSHNPQSNMKLASGTAPIHEMTKRGVICALGTDGTSSNNDHDMWEEMRSASFQQKLATLDPKATPAYETLKIATVNGAHAMGMAGEIGILKEGALADIIVVDMLKPHLQPLHDVVANLVYCAKPSDVVSVMIDGRFVVEGGEILTSDLPKLYNRVNDVVTRVKSELGK